jgi:predicted dehydrogenase
VEREHAPALRTARTVEIVAVADPSTERARLVGRILGLPKSACYEDPLQLLERSDIDSVSIATPPNVRVELVQQTAAAGKHVICEKPLATTLADADAMLQACATAGVNFAVYHNYLYFPETLLARRLIAEGTIGEVVATEISGYGARPWAGTDTYRPRWRERVAESGGGVLMDVAVHGVYLTEAFHGRRIEGVTASIRYDEHGLDVAAYPNHGC